MKIQVKKQDTLLRDEIYRYEFDEHKNKTIKHIESSGLPERITSSSTYHYANEYEDDKLIKKSCLHENIVLYMNQYTYEGTKLIRIQKYNTPPDLNLWRTELLSYEKNKVIKTSYMPNGIVSHYSISELSAGIPMNRQVLSPVKGLYHWEFTNFEPAYCSVYISENQLTGKILLEILKHIQSIKAVHNEPLLLVIECSDTFVDTSDKTIYDIEMSYREQGISIQYAP